MMRWLMFTLYSPLAAFGEARPAGPGRAGPVQGGRLYSAWWRPRLASTGTI